MRGFAVLASVALLAALAACAEPVGPSYAYAPAVDTWPGYCCAPLLITPVPFHHHHHHHHHGGHHHGGGHGGRH